MYKGTHPQVQRDTDAAFVALESMLSGQDAIVIGVSGGVLLVQGRPVKDESPALKTFSDMLKEKNIASIKASRGASKEEFVYLAQILFMDPEDALHDDAIKPELLANLRSFQITEVRFGAAPPVPQAVGPSAPGQTADAAIVQALRSTRHRFCGGLIWRSAVVTCRRRNWAPNSRRTTHEYTLPAAGACRTSTRRTTTSALVAWRVVAAR
jgi:hypothetical protein